MRHKAPLGVILAGGLAQRLGGDKPLRSIAGRTMLERVAARLMPQCDGLILNANGDAARFAALGLPICPDNVEGHPGPLAGLLAALDWTVFHKPQLEWVLTAPADAPFLPRDLVARLQQAQDAEGGALAIAASGGHIHPVVGIWNVALRDDLRRALVTDGIRRVSEWIGSHRMATATWATQPIDPFFNVNTAEDLAQAEALAAMDERA